MTLFPDPDGHEITRLDAYRAKCSCKWDIFAPNPKQVDIAVRRHLEGKRK